MYNNIGYVAAPFFGRLEAAATAKLNIVTAGAPDLLDKVEHILSLLGRTWHMGEDPYAGHLAKIAGLSAPIHRPNGPMIATGGFRQEPLALQIALKGIGLAIDEAAISGIPLLFAEVLLDGLKRNVDQK